MVKNKKIQRILVLAITFAIGLSTYACGTPKNTSVDTTRENITGVSESQKSSEESKALVIYFNYSDNIDTTGLDVDAISSASLHANADGNAENLKLMADEIAKKKNADIFAVRINEVYPAEFEEMAPIARTDIEKKTTFTFKEMPENIEQYDVIYVGSPIWWYELPQPMKVFINSINISGKKVVPFGIHRGSGFNGILNEYKKAWPDSQVVDGFTINADKKNSEVLKGIDEFLDKLDN